MTQAASAAYIEINSRLDKKPIYFAVFSGIATRYSTAPVDGATAEYVTSLEVPDSTGGEIELNEGRSEISNLDFELQDRDADIIALVANNVMLNRSVVIRRGFRGLDESEYIVIFRGNISRVSSKGIFYNFGCASLDHLQKSNVFTIFAETTLRDELEQGETATMEVEDESDFPSAGVVVVDNELIEYESTTSPSSDLDELNTLTRAKYNFGDGDVTHDAGTEVTQAIALEGNPIDLALQILTSTGAGSNGAYDVLDADQGLGIDQDDIDVAKFESERDRWYIDAVFRFVIHESVEAKKFLETELFSKINAYPVKLADGRISLKIYASPLPIDVGTSLQEKDIRGIPDWDANFRELVNRVEVFFDFDSLDKEFDGFLAIDNLESQSTFGTVKTKKIETKGLRTSLAGEKLIRGFAGRVLSRFATPPVKLRFGLHSTQSLLEPADLVEITHSKVPNASGTRGIEEELFEIIERNVDWGSGEVDIEVLGTQLSAAGTRKKYAVIGPSTLGNWTAESQENKDKYAFISNSSGEMSDGTPGAVIA